MKTQYHILNGDALKEQFPPELEGNIIVCRECLVDGDVKETELEKLFSSRAKFLSENYGGEEQDYFEKSVPEFQKILSIEDDAEINLWFEDDLFCQVNFWFVSILLVIKMKPSRKAFLIRPKVHNQYGFGGIDQSGLLSLYDERLEIKQLSELAKLWELYQSNSLEKLVKAAQTLKDLPFIFPAVEAHKARIPTQNSLGKPTESLIQIMKDLNTKEFGPVFREFCKRESIYGYGDLQVKRLFDSLVES